MIVSGTITVSFTASDGSQQQLSADVAVDRRNWTWYSAVGGSQGAQGEIDGCFSNSPDLFGLTASAYCTNSTTGYLFSPTVMQLSNGNGYTATSVQGNGPNAGFWYINQTSASMNLRSQLARRFRGDGSAYAVTGNTTVANACNAQFGNTNDRNIYSVNTWCMNVPGFSDFTACIWGHEGMHLSAAIGSARSPTNDVYLLWEPEVSYSAFGVQSDADFIYSNANDRVFNASQNAHNLMTLRTHSFWDNRDGSSWAGTSYTHLCP